MSQEQDKLAKQAYTENKDGMEKVLNLLRSAIDNDEMPKAKELLQDNKKPRKKSSNRIKRPSNSNIIYTNQLGKFGLLEIIRKFCEIHEINKQKLVPISKKVSSILWKELSPAHQKFFENLALEVKEEHKAMYPCYTYKPKRNPPNYNKFKLYDPNESKTKTQEYHEVEDLDPNESDDELPVDEPIDDSLIDGPPKFYEHPPLSPLETTYPKSSPSSLEVNYDEYSPEHFS